MQSSPFVKIKEALLFLPNYLRSPIEGIKKLPNPDLLSISLLHIIISIFSGLFTGIVSQKTWNIAFGLFIFPVISLCISYATCFCLRILIQLVFAKEIDFRHLYIAVVLANIPFLFLRILSSISFTVDLVGTAMTCFLLAVAMVENFHLEKIKTLKVLSFLYGLFLLGWISNILMSSYLSY